jgi:ankyrin repeat protein
VCLPHHNSIQSDANSHLDDILNMDISRCVSSGKLRDYVNIIGMNREKINERTPDHETPLMVVIKNNLPECAIRLIDLGADITLRNKEGRNALHYACLYGLYPVVRVLVESCNADVNATDSQLVTPLHCACAALGNNSPLKVVTIVQLLLDYEADVEAQTIHGIKAFAYACRWARKIMRINAFRYAIFLVICNKYVNMCFHIGTRTFLKSCKCSLQRETACHCLTTREFLFLNEEPRPEPLQSSGLHR